MGSDGLPNGWAWARLADVADIVRLQVIPSKQPSKSFNYLSIENVESDSGRLLNFAPTTGGRIRSAKLAFTTRDVLYSKLRPYLNKVYLPTFDGISATDLIPIRPRFGISRDFIAYFLRTRDVVEYARQRMRGIQLPRLTVRDLQSLSIPVPPSSEQTRIAFKVGQIFQELEKATQATGRIPGIVKRLRQSILLRAFSGVLVGNCVGDEPIESLLAKMKTERHERLSASKTTAKDQREQLDSQTPLPALPHGWRWVALDELHEEGRPIIYGIIKPGPPVDDGVPYVRINEMQTGQIDVASLRKTTKERAEKFKRARLKAGDILVSKDGTIGKVAMVPPDLEGGNITQHIVRVSIDRAMDGDYVAWAIRSPVCQSFLVSNTKGIALRGVNVEDFRKLPIPLAPLREQERIAQRVTELFMQLDQIEQGVTIAFEQAGTIRKSVLIRAFRGQLLPQNPNDEPASVLLERIRSTITPDKKSKRRYLRDIRR